MSNASFSYVNGVDVAGALLSASNPVSTLPVANLVNPNLVSPFRSSAVSGWFLVDMLTNQSIDFLAIGQAWNAAVMAPTDTFRHLLDADGGTPGAGAVLDTGAIACNIQPGYGMHAYIPGSRKTARYWKCIFNAASLAAQAFVDFGRAWAGPLITASVNPIYGYGEQWDDPSVVTVATRSGAEYIDVFPGRRNIVLEFDALNTTEGMVTFKELARVVGVHGQMFYTLDLTGTYLSTEMMFCRRAAADGITRPRLNLYDKQFHLRQSL